MICRWIGGRGSRRVRVRARVRGLGTRRLTRAVRLRDAIALLRPAVSATRGTWADLGAGTGTFTLALAELLGPGGRVFAVDRDGRALAQLRAAAARNQHAGIEIVQADF